MKFLPMGILLISKEAVSYGKRNFPTGDRCSLTGPKAF